MKYQPRSGKQIMKYLCNYLAILILVLLACYPFIWQAYNVANENVIQQSRNRMREGMDHMERAFEHLNVMGNFLRQDPDIRRISRIRGELAINEYLYMTEAMKQVSNLFLADNNNFCITFLLFPGNDVFISNEQVTESFTDYYGKFFRAGELGRMEFCRKVFDAEDRTSFFQVEDVLYYESMRPEKVSNPLICVQKVESTQWVGRIEFVIVSVLPGEQIEEWMLTEEMRGICPFRILDLQGGMLFGTDRAGELWEEGKGISRTDGSGEPWKVLEEKNDTYSLEVELWLPKSLVRQQIMQMVEMLFLYLIVGLIGAVILAVVFSCRQYRPVRRLMDTANEYKKQLVEMEDRLRFSTMEKLILRGISTQAEAESMENFLKRPVEFFCIASIEILDDQGQYSDVVLRIQEYLSERLENEILCVLSGFQELIVLIFLRNEDPPHVMGLKAVFEEMTAVEKEGVVLNIGISAIGNGIQNMSVCYEQALQVRRIYGREDMGSVNAYTLQQDHGFSILINVETAQKLKNHLLGGDKSMIERQLLRMLDKWETVNKSMLLYQQQIFFFLRHVIWCTMEELSLDSDKVQIPYYHSSWSLKEMLDIIKACCFQVCDCVEEARRSRNQKLKSDILELLQEEYTRCDLTAGIVCQKIGISEKYLYQFIKEQTGKTFVGYLEELRIRHAEKLLLQGDYSNAQIAEESGFGSVNTLYRAFHKYKGVTPAVYRRIMQEQDRKD